MSYILCPSSYASTNCPFDSLKRIQSARLSLPRTTSTLLMRLADTSAIRDEISRLRDRTGVLGERLTEIDGVESRLPVRSRRETLRDG